MDWKSCHFASSLVIASDLNANLEPHYHPSRHACGLWLLGGQSFLDIDFLRKFGYRCICDEHRGKFQARDSALSDSASIRAHIPIAINLTVQAAFAQTVKRQSLSWRLDGQNQILERIYEVLPVPDVVNSKTNMQHLAEIFQSKVEALCPPGSTGRSLTRVIDLYGEPRWLLGLRCTLFSSVFKTICQKTYVTKAAITLNGCRPVWSPMQDVTHHSRSVVYRISSSALINHFWEIFAQKDTITRVILYFGAYMKKGSEISATSFNETSQCWHKCKVFRSLHSKEVTGRHRACDGHLKCAVVMAPWWTAPFNKCLHGGTFAIQ